MTTRRSDLDLVLDRARRCMTTEEAARLDAQLHRIRVRLARSATPGLSPDTTTDSPERTAVDA